MTTNTNRLKKMEKEIEAGQPGTTESRLPSDGASCSLPSYVRYGSEWEAELMKLPKKHLIGMIRRELTGSPITKTNQ